MEEACVETADLISVKSLSQQVSEKRFDPILFDANIQTDTDLIEKYVAKETVSQEVFTDPVNIVDMPSPVKNSMC
jgi:hypothetical protein